MRQAQEPAAASTLATPPSLPRFPVQFFEGPVGGRLQHFASNWSLIGADPWVLAVLSSGYYLPLERDVPLTSSPPPGLGYSPGHPLFAETLRQLETLLVKGAVEPVADDSPGFYSRLFLVPKKSTEWRPVIDLSALNEYMDPPRLFSAATTTPRCCHGDPSAGTTDAAPLPLVPPVSLPPVVVVDLTAE